MNKVTPSSRLIALKALPIAFGNNSDWWAPRKV